MATDKLRNLYDFDRLPDSAFVSEHVVRGLWGGISRDTVWAWVKKGQLPQPHKIGEQMTRWRVGELRAALRNNAKPPEAT